MSDQLVVTYSVPTNGAKEIADAIRVEQSIEFPNELAPEWIQREVVGQITGIEKGDENRSTVTISYNVENTGFEFPQLLNVLWGNVSILPSIRITAIDYPESLLSKFKGPRFGVPGLREMFNAPTRPLASTALKPMGSSPADYAKAAYTIAKSGFDTIKDDHSLANQKWALWEDRVRAVADAVAQANSETGGHCLYAPSLNLPANEMFDAAKRAKELGATSLLILPGLSSHDVMRVIAENDEIALPIMAHPSFLGSLVISEDQGLSHGIVFGEWARMVGADITIFPNFGGRFSFSKEQCLDIRDAAQKPFGNYKPIWISPAGGMSPDRIAEMISVYGKDTASLIGGALHRGDLATNSAEMVRILAGLG
jgi:ribulose-bisphosphate carboxylase large chain